MTVNELSSLIGGKVICLPDDTREIRDVYIGDLLSWVMGKAKSDDAWITIMSNINVVAVASLSDTACVVMAEGVEPDATVKATADAKGVNIISSPMSAYEIAVILGREINNE